MYVWLSLTRFLRSRQFPSFLAPCPLPNFACSVSMTSLSPLSLYGHMPPSAPFVGVILLFRAALVRLDPLEHFVAQCPAWSSRACLVELLWSSVPKACCTRVCLCAGLAGFSLSRVSPLTCTHHFVPVLICERSVLLVATSFVLFSLLRLVRASVSSAIPLS
jgi:hypothetical protein